MVSFSRPFVRRRRRRWRGENDQQQDSEGGRRQRSGSARTHGLAPAACTRQSVGKVGAHTEPSLAILSSNSIPTQSDDRPDARRGQCNTGRSNRNKAGNAAEIANTQHHKISQLNGSNGHG